MITPCEICEREGVPASRHMIAWPVAETHTFYSPAFLSTGMICADCASDAPFGVVVTPLQTETN